MQQIWFKCTVAKIVILFQTNRPSIEENQSNVISNASGQNGNENLINAERDNSKSRYVFDTTVTKFSAL